MVLPGSVVDEQPERKYNEHYEINGCGCWDSCLKGAVWAI